MVSIIIIIKNHRIIERLLKELTRVRKPEKTEIVVVDGSEGKLDDIKNNFSTVKWVYFYSNKKYTIPEQRNLGINKSKGEIIAFIDADCLPAKDWLINLIRPIRENNENIVTGFIKSSRKYPRKWEFDYKGIKNQRYINFAPTMNTAFKRDVFKKIGNYNEIFSFGGEDTDLCWRALDAGYKIMYNPKAIIFHDWGNLSKNIFRQFTYGRMTFHLLIKYPRRMFRRENAVFLSYPIYILLIPLTFISIYYPLLIFIPIVQNLREIRSVEITFETVLFNLINGIGIITEGLRYFYNKIGKLSI
jgi:GT2 family glycosyltransferase